MPRIKAAKKAMRQSAVRRTRNVTAKRRIHEAEKEMMILIRGGKKEEAMKKLPGVFSLIDRAAKHHVLHKNKAARKKSQLSRLAR